MNTKQKEIIAKLVAEKVWGWREERIKTGDPETTLVWVDDKSLLRWDVAHHGIAWAVFSWPGFGLTVEVMLVEPKTWQRFNIKADAIIDRAFSRGNLSASWVIYATQVSALDALGIGWKGEVPEENSGTIDNIYPLPGFVEINGKQEIEDEK